MLWYRFADSTSSVRLRSLELVVNSKLIMLPTGGWWMKHALLKSTSRKKNNTQEYLLKPWITKGILRGIRKRKSAHFFRWSLASLGHDAWYDKSYDFHEVEPVTSRYRCNTLTNWAMKPLTLGAGHLWVLISPWAVSVKLCMKNVIYWTANFEINEAMIIAVMNAI